MAVPVKAKPFGGAARHLDRPTPCSYPRPIKKRLVLAPKHLIQKESSGMADNYTPEKFMVKLKK